MRIKTKALLILLSVIIILTALTSLKRFLHFPHQISIKIPKPNEGDDGEKNELNRKLYFENMHRTAPGTDWHSIEIGNKINAKNEVIQLRTFAPVGTNGTETFANGIISGEWSERGSNNQAGMMQVVDYVASLDKLYYISPGGTLWMGNLDGSNWTVLNQDYQFTLSALKVFLKSTGEPRILTAANNIPKYSDDNGITFTDASGIGFPIAWGGNHISSYMVLNDIAKTIYCLVYMWDPIPFAPRTKLYISTDQGSTYSSIYTFPHGQEQQISFCIPNNSFELYALDNNSNSGISTIFSISGNIVSILNTTPDIETNVNCVLKGYRNESSLIFYAMTGNNKMYKSTSQGANWDLQSNLPQQASKFNVSLNDPDKLCFGGIDAFRSVDGGTTWLRVNSWVDYYGNPSIYLHADIRELEYFKKADNTEFLICNNDGGSYVSFDNFITNSNLSLSGLKVGQYYDVLTDPLNPDDVFIGSQDQGFQRNTTATSVPGPLNFSQVISGDYGYLVLTNLSAHLWTEYPFGEIYYYNDPLNNFTGRWKMPGNQLPEYSWMLPTSNTANNSANEIYMAGGNITGGGGSYLIKLTATSFNSFEPSQFNYDFRANSTDGKSGISAIGVSNLNDNKIYVATEDGTFFYSNDIGGNWNKSVFTGPGPKYLYGSTILPSKISSNLVWFGGAGYSNPGVYKSTDGGITFTAMANGLPNTLVHKIVSNPDESLLFAATEAGPYVYVTTDDMWYSLRGSAIPIQDYFTVQYIDYTNTLRFGTYGRGIWDLKITSTFPFTLVLVEGDKTIDQKGKLLWNTTSQLINDQFIIQRNKDAINLKKIWFMLSNQNNTKNT